MDACLARPPVRTQSLDGFSAPTRAWFSASFAEPTPAQAQAWAAIGKGENALVVAPTGSGKTLAAFLWAIDKLANEPVPQDPLLRCRVLYISPLKALAVDIERNLRSPLTGVGHAARRLGAASARSGSACAPGDTAADERPQAVRQAAGHPDHHTRSPLFLLLTSKAREGLRGVETVIIDEYTPWPATSAVAHLALSMERLDALRRAPPGRRRPGRRQPGRRSGRGSGGPAARVPAHRLSATVRPPEEVAAFLGGSRPVTIAAPPSEKAHRAHDHRAGPRTWPTWSWPAPRIPRRPGRAGRVSCRAAPGGPGGPADRRRSILAARGGTRPGISSRRTSRRSSSRTPAAWPNGSAAG